MSTPPSPPPLPGAKKPSAMASCILLGLILVFVGGLGGGGYWAYKKYLMKPAADPVLVADNGKQKPAQKPAPVPPAKEPEKSPTPPDTKPVNDTLGAKPSGENPPIIPHLPEAVPEKSSERLKPQTTQETVEATLPGETPMVPEVSPVSPENTDPVVPVETVTSFAEDSPEARSLKEDADRRIDEAPSDVYSDDDKTKVREAIRQAKRLTRVATLQFGTGSAILGSNERTRLKKALLTPQAENLLSDPQAVFFLIGFADSSGSSAANRTISQKRAAGIGSVLKSFRVGNRAYAVGIGSSNLISGAKQEKNRAVEVWVVLP